MNLKKLIAALLCAAMIGTAFAGCGQNGTDTAVTPDDTIQAEATVEEEALLPDLSQAFNETAELSVEDAMDADIKFDTDYINGLSTKDEVSEEEEPADIIGTIIENNKDQDDVEDPKETAPGEEGDIPFDQAHPDIFQSEDVEYADNTILVKLNSSFDEKVFDELKTAGVGFLDFMFAMSDATWYTAYLYKDTDVNQVIEDVRQFRFVDVAEYNFKSETTAIEQVELNDAIAENELKDEQWVLKSSGIQAAWNELEAIGKAPGGSSSVTVAVIDTGVDYTHEDLKNNIWVNMNEIPDNGIDDDGNGYIDDYYGVNMTADNARVELSGMDDNGHGTHVAGIIAAENNDKGVAGIAYNTKIMPIKAGDASGYFNQDDIAKGIIYAYEHGADVINMSFGGVASSVAVQDALEVAYLRCVLVASAGNDGKVNEGLQAVPNYPAAFSFVLGVMSVDMTDRESSFTNYDKDLYSNVEYEVYAPGYQILSTIPGDKYTKMSGTSMAAPVVAAQAALLRSYFTDTDLYPTKFIYGQIVGTANTAVTCFDQKLHGIHNIPGAVDFYGSIVDVPTPDLGMSDYTLFDSAEFIADEAGLTEGLLKKNNGDGMVDAGEVLALGFTIKNRWGMAEDVTVSIDATNNFGVANPYVTFLNNDLSYPSVGTYSENDCGKIYNNDLDALASKDSLWTGWKNPFYIQIDKDCPNDYTITLNVTITSKNALDPTDETVYETKESILLNVRRGVLLPSRIEEDTTLTKDNYYILANAMTVAEEATLTIEPGTQIQVWSNDPEDAYAEKKIAYIDVRGKLIANGTEEEPVSMFPSDLMHNYIVELNKINDGYIELNYTNIENPELEIDVANNCEFTENYAGQCWYRYLTGNGTVSDSNTYTKLYIKKASECSMYKMKTPYMRGKFERCIFVDCDNDYVDGSSGKDVNSFVECVFYGNNLFWDPNAYEDSTSTLNYALNLQTISAEQVLYNAYTGTTYIVLGQGSARDTTHYNNEYSMRALSSMIDKVDYFAEKFGGHIMHVDSQEEVSWVASRINYSSNYNDYDKTGYMVGLYQDPKDGTVYQYDGSLLPEDVDLVVNKEPMPGYIRSGKLMVNDNADDYLYRTDRYIIEIPGEIYITEIHLDEYLVEMDIESTYQIEASVVPDSGDVTKLIYESMDSTVATVDENGLISPVALGTAQIRVYAPDKGVYNYVTVNVVDVVEAQGLAFVEDAMTVAVGTQKRLGLVFTPINATKKTVTYEVEDPTVATVSSKGTLTALKVGETTVTVYGEGGLTATMQVQCVIPATSISFEEELYAALTNQTIELPQELYPVITPADTTNKNIIWESANPAIVKVEADETGNYMLITGEMEGSTILRATLEDSDLYAEVQIAVSENFSSAKIVKLDSNYGNYYALLDDGSLWTWGSNHHYPYKLSLDKAVDFHIDSYLYVCYEDGSVEQFTISNGLPAVSMAKRSLGMTKVEVRSLWVYMLDSKGQIWAIEDFKNGSVTEIPVAETMTELYNCNGTILAVSENGTIYTLLEGIATQFMTDVDKLIIGIADFYVHKDGQVYEYNSDLDLLTTYTLDPKVSAAYEVFYYIEDGKLFLQGQNYYGRLGVGTTDEVYYFTQMQKVDSVESVYVFYNNIFVQTVDGKLYGAGSGNGYAFGDGQTADSYIPKRILLGIQTSEEPLTLTETNVTTKENAEEILILQEDALKVTYSNCLLAGNTYSGIGIKNSEGSYLSSTVELRLNQVILAPENGWVEGEYYTAVIPANGLSSGTTGNEKYEVSFIYEGPDVTDTEGDSEDEIMQDTVRNEAILADRYYITQEEVAAWIEEYIEKGYNHRFYSNVILNRTNDDDVSTWMRVVAPGSSNYATIGMAENYWGTTNEELINKQILDYDDYQSLANVIVGDYLTEAPETTYPYVVDAYLTVEGETKDTVGKGEVTFVVNFNRAMDTDIDLEVAFGSAYPYRDYEVEGAYVSPTQWQGTINLSTLIENGYQYWCISNGKAAGTSMKLYEDWGRFPFKIDTSAAQALIMQAVVEADGIYLSWTQDEYETLAGYNVYRSTEEDGLYEKLNKTVIPADTKEFFDDAIEPGETYYYNFTVVDTDLTESEPSGKVSVTALDTMAPNIYHSPVFTAFTGNNLVVSATVTDNVGIHSVELYYRTKGADSWKTKSMTNNNDKFSAVIPADDIAIEGLEYYLVAFDGISYTYKGSEQEPYEVTVQLSVSDNDLGDVDGNGAIELKDAMMVLMAINDKYNMTAEEFARADIDGSGNLEAFEALRIMMYVNGSISSVPF